VTKLAFVFPGQGSQKVGMGADIQANDPELFDRILGQADEVSGLPIRQLCLEGPAEALTETQVAQPALFAVSIAAAHLARRRGLRVAAVAGHSLGEYTAAVSVGALDFEDGLKLVCLRGRLMAEAQSGRPGTMDAITGLPLDKVEQACQAAQKGDQVVGPANLNTPSQTVISGDEEAVERAMQLARDAGAKRALRLQVGAAFHSPLMQPTQAALAKQMDGLTWHDPAVPMASNASGTLVATGAEVRQALIDQITSRVRWVQCVEALKEAGVTTFFELGPGQTLSGLIRQIDRQLDTSAADSLAKLDAFADAHPDLVQEGRPS
jgi:[acyl-carrier-protein] S-malonyltransferase